MSDKPSKVSQELFRRISNEFTKLHDCTQLAVRLEVGAEFVESQKAATTDPNAIAFNVLMKWSRKEEASAGTLFDALNTDPFDHLARKYKEQLLPESMSRRPMSDQVGRVQGPNLLLMSELQQTQLSPAQASSVPQDVLAETGHNESTEEKSWPELPRSAYVYSTGSVAWPYKVQCQLASNHHPPASLPSFGKGYSLPPGVREPPIPIGPSSLLSAYEADSRGGYEADFVAQLKEHYKCPICLLALRVPMQTDCGHRFCRSCIEPILRRQRPQCPIDKEPVQTIFPDNFCKREILSLVIKCKNTVAGCNWTGPLMELKAHLDSCSFTLVRCCHRDRGCRSRVLRSKFRQHAELECEYRDSLCSHCQSNLSLNKIEAHVRDTCPEVNIPCLNRCGAMMKRKQMPEHIENVCLKTIFECDFCVVGCPFKGDRSSMKDHMEASLVYHLSLTVERNSSLEQQIDKLNKRVQTMTRLDKLNNFKPLFGETTTSLNAPEHNSSQHGGTASNSAMEVDEAVRMAAKAEAEALAAQQKVTSIESKVASIDRQMGHVNTLIECSDAILAEFDLRLLSQETASFGGVLVWKIPDFNRHFEEARTGKKPSLYSPPFYTSRHGYKLCARVYLYGDSVGKGSHMSVFFVVMRGEFDAILAWPFHQKVTLTLLDQSPAKRHISDTFMPDPSSSSFQRPSSEMNIASGCPRFVSIDTLRAANEYVKDNAIFLKVAIDCSGLPTY